MQMGRELLMAVKDGYTREAKGRKDLGDRKRLERPSRVREWISRYSKRYEYENCYIHENLRNFDAGVKRTCGLANKAAE